jgi:hypothetical protein
VAWRIWEGDVTPDVVRVWGYDDELFLLEQDEDLTLYDSAYFAVLLELAGDDDCPKQDYAFSILCQFCREQVTRGGSRCTTALKVAWEAIPEPPTGLPREWHQFVGRLLSYTQPNGPIDKEAARMRATELLLGITRRVGDVVDVESERPGWWRFSIRANNREYVDVCESNGVFSYAR